MKFMFFNLMAVIAILYLVAVDGKPLKTLPDYLSSLSSKDLRDAGEKGVEKGKELAERARKKLQSFKAKGHQAKPPETPDVVIETSAVAPQFSAPVEVAMRPVNKVLPFSETKLAGKRVEEPLKKPAANLAALSFKQKPQQKFMSRAERRRDLNRLAHDMEMMFADKLSD